MKPHILASLTATLSFWIPWALFVAGDHGWKAFGSNFLGAQLFGLMYNWPLILTASLILSIPAKIIKDKTKMEYLPQAAIWVVSTLIVFVFIYLEQTHLILWRLSLTILSSFLAIFVYFKLINRKTEPKGAAD